MRSADFRRAAAPSSALAALVMCTVLGCGSLAFKSGATGRDHQIAVERCRTRGDSEGAALARCMQEQGWVTMHDAGTPAAAASGAASPEPPTRPRPQAAGTITEPVTPTPIAPPLAEPQPTSQDGDTLITVQGWFKLGGTAEALAAARRRCAEHLGIRDVPAQPDRVSRALLECLEADGWRPLR